MDRMQLVVKIQNILTEVLPENFKITVKPYNGYFGKSEYIQIKFSPSDYLINGVQGQTPCVVSLSLDVTTMILKSQMYGGTCVFRKTDPENFPKEWNLALGRIKIPFRKPKSEEKFVLKAIRVFAERYLQKLKENRHLLLHVEKVDYSFLDNV